MTPYSLPYAKFSGGEVKRKRNRKGKYIKRSRRSYKATARRSSRRSKHRVQKGGDIFSSLLQGLGSVAETLLPIIL